MYNVDKILKLVEKSGIQKKEIAEKTGLSASIFAEWKKGKMKPTSKAVQKIADFFNLPISEFYVYDTNNPSPQDTKTLTDIDMEEALNIFLREKLGREPTKEDIELADKIFDTFAQGFKIGRKK